MSREAFRAGMRVTQELKGTRAAKVIESDLANIASYTRLNGSGTPVLVDAATGNWLLAVGPWFHEAGYGSGAEPRLLARFGEVGAERLAREVEGFFVIVAGSPATREVTVITDVAGTLHCYQRQFDWGTALSLSSLSLAALDDVTLDAVGCQEFLRTAAMCEDRTFFKEVRKLESARCFVYKAGVLQDTRRYWHATDLDPDSLDGAESVSALREAVLSAARKIAAVFPRPAVDLTGGYDSRAGVAAFVAANVKFTTAVGGAPNHPDVLVSRRIASAMGLPHHHFVPDTVRTFEQLQGALPFTDGEYDIVDYARIRDIQQDLSQRFDVSVNSYSGEIGRGYGWELLIPQTGQRAPIDAQRIATRRFVNPHFNDSILRPELRMDASEHFGQVMAHYAQGIGHLPNTTQYDYCMTMMRAQRWYGRIASSTNQIWPCLSFFLLRSIMKPMLETNTRSRENSLLFRRLLLEIAPRLTEFPLANGYPPVPVTVKTFYRFWPLIPLYAGKAVGRLRRSVLPRAGTTADPPDTPRLQLWNDPAVRETLRPRHMRSAEILVESELEKFLQRSMQPAFELAGEWSALLTLECTLQRLSALASVARAPSAAVS